MPAGFREVWRQRGKRDPMAATGTCSRHTGRQAAGWRSSNGENRHPADFILGGDRDGAGSDAGGVADDVGRARRQHQHRGGSSSAIG